MIKDYMKDYLYRVNREEFIRADNVAEAMEKFGGEVEIIERMGRYGWVRV